MTMTTYDAEMLSRLLHKYGLAPILRGVSETVRTASGINANVTNTGEITSLSLENAQDTHRVLLDLAAIIDN